MGSDMGRKRAAPIASRTSIPYNHSAHSELMPGRSYRPGITKYLGKT